MKCIAGTSSSSYLVAAIANCCVFSKDSINAVGSITNEAQSNNQVVTKCPPTTILTGCVVDYQSGSYPGPQQTTNTPPAQVGTEGGIDTKHQCIAEARTIETNVRGGA